MHAAAEPLLLDDATIAAWLPVRDPRAHKGSNGTLLCVCGSLDYVGAALLCSLAAARAGAGVVILAVPRSLQLLFAGRIPEIVTLGLEETGNPADIDPQAAGHAFKDRQPDALVIGSGLRETNGYHELLLGLLRRQGPPIVIDGGALSMLARSTDWWSGVDRTCVLTPHPGEFARITSAPVGDDDGERLERCREAAQRFGQVVVLKGAATVVADADGRTALSPFTNAALATAGTGDVLAGTIGSLLAQGVSAFEAACLGVYLHGGAAGRISERLGDSGLLASDLPLEIAVERHRLARLRGRPASARLGFRQR